MSLIAELAERKSREFCRVGRAVYATDDDGGFEVAMCPDERTAEMAAEALNLAIANARADNTPRVETLRRGLFLHAIHGDPTRGHWQAFVTHTSRNGRRARLQLYSWADGCPTDEVTVDVADLRDVRTYTAEDAWRRGGDKIVRDGMRREVRR